MFAGDQAAILPGLPETTRQSVMPNLEAQNLDTVLYVYVDPENELLASNITLLTCGEAAGIVLDADTWLEVYAESEIEAEVVTDITVLGDETTVFRINASSALATYQVPFRAGGECESIATLVSLPGEDDRIDDFVTFLEHCPASHVVFVSSGAVYDGLEGTVTPETPVSPLLPYAISKYASEQYLRFFVERRGSVDSGISVRFFGAYGPYEAPRKITTRWLQAMAGGQREFVVRGDGENLIDFMYVDDAVDGFLALVQARGQSTVVDFASGAPVSVNEVVEGMARKLGVEVTVRNEGQVAEYIRFRSGDTAMRERFGITPVVTFDDGLRRLAAFLAAGGRPSAES